MNDLTIFITYELNNKNPYVSTIRIHDDYTQLYTDNVIIKTFNDLESLIYKFNIDNKLALRIKLIKDKNTVKIRPRVSYKDIINIIQTYKVRDKIEQLIIL